MNLDGIDTQLGNNLHCFHVATEETPHREWIDTPGWGPKEIEVHLFFWDEHNINQIKVLNIQHNKGITLTNWSSDEGASTLLRKEIVNLRGKNK